MPDLNLAMIGNCGFGALVDRKARVVWSCYPFFDGDPVFLQTLRHKQSFLAFGIHGGNQQCGW